MAKKQLHWYARDVEAYGRDTAHLSLLEHGAYTLLLDHYYRSKRPLPANAEQLHRICRCTTDAERSAVMSVVEQFFVLPEDGPFVYRNARADEEIRKSFEISDKRSAAASTRYNNDDANASAIAPANADTPTPTEVHTEAIASVSPMATIPNCPAEQLVELYHELLPLNPRCRALNDARRGAMRARWREWWKRGKYATLDEGLVWWGRLFSYAAESKFLTGGAQPQPGRPPFVADIDFVFAPSSNLKLVEGKYHEEAA